MAIRGILLDKDGTLIDCDLTWAPILRLLAEEMKPPGQVDDLVDGAGLDPATGRLRAGSTWAAGSTIDLVRLWWPEADKAAVDALRHRIDGICADHSPRTSVPLIDLAEFMEMIAARGLEAGIATNDSTASVKAFLEAQGLADRIAHVIGYDSVATPKPAPDMVHRFCEMAGLTPVEIAVVGDNTHDLEMGRAAGAGAVLGVLSGNGSRADLEPLADAILDSVADLAAWLDANER